MHVGACVHVFANYLLARKKPFGLSGVKSPLLASFLNICVDYPHMRALCADSLYAITWRAAPSTPEKSNSTWYNLPTA